MSRVSKVTFQGCCLSALPGVPGLLAENWI